MLLLKSFLGKKNNSFFKISPTEDSMHTHPHITLKPNKKAFSLSALWGAFRGQGRSGRALVSARGHKEISHAGTSTPEWSGKQGATSVPFTSQLPWLFRCSLRFFLQQSFIAFVSCFYSCKGTCHIKCLSLKSKLSSMTCPHFPWSQADDFTPQGRCHTFLLSSKCASPVCFSSERKTLWAFPLACVFLK